MKILFIGCVEASYEELKLLLVNNKNIVGIITKEKSSFNSDFCDLSTLGEQYHIPVQYVKNINDKDAVNFIKGCAPDVIYCFGWSQLIKTEVLSIPRLGIIGSHPAELPFNRSRHPIIWALALGLEKTASTFFFMNENADSGDIISQREIEIKYTDYARDLYDRITRTECEQILLFTDELENGNCMGRKQDLSIGNTWRKRTKMDGVIDWRMSSRAIYNLVRALSRPYAGAHFNYKDSEYKVWKCEEFVEESFKNIEPGKVIRYVSDTNFYVKAYDNLIHITECDRCRLQEGEYL